MRTLLPLLVATCVTCWHSPFVRPARRTCCVMLSDSDDLSACPTRPAIDDSQDRDGKCRAWLEVHYEDPFSTRGTPRRRDLVEKRMEALRTASEAWHTATPLPVERDYLEASALLGCTGPGQGCNRFLDECFAALDIDGASVLSLSLTLHPVGMHAFELDGSDMADSSMVLFNEAWASPEQAPKLRIGEIDMDNDFFTVAPSFRDWLRGFASIPMELIPYIGDSDAYTMMGVCREWGGLEDHWKDVFQARQESRGGYSWADLCTYLDDNGQPRDDDAKRSIALMEAGHRQLLDFLATVWGVGPVTEDEVRRWDAEMVPQDEALEALMRSFET